MKTIAAVNEMMPYCQVNDAAQVAWKPDTAALNAL